MTDPAHGPTASDNGNVSFLFEKIEYELEKLRKWRLFWGKLFYFELANLEKFYFSQKFSTFCRFTVSSFGSSLLGDQLH